MMHPYASAAKLLGGGPILETGVNTMACFGLPPPRIVIGCRRYSVRRLRNLVLSEFSFHAARNTTPGGTSPVVTRRHRAINNLRARATIMVLRVPRAFSVRARNHCAKAQSFWNMRNRHANWIMPRRTRAFPERASLRPAVWTDDARDTGPISADLRGAQSPRSWRRVGRAAAMAGFDPTRPLP